LIFSRITLPSFQIAGGILLFILGMQMALGIEFGHAKDHAPSAAGVVIGTPLLCGPGAITTVILLAKEYGLFVPAVAIALSLLATWLILRYSTIISSCWENVSQISWQKCSGCWSHLSRSI